MEAAAWPETPPPKPDLPPGPGPGPGLPLELSARLLQEICL